MFTDIFEGTVITGDSLSFTVTVKVHVAIFPAASVAVDVTIVLPVWKNVPEAGEVDTVEEQLSDEVTLKFTIAPH